MTELAPGLYLVSTPIGNLGDMTIRGLEILKEADLIGAEDTRHSRILLNHFEIKTPMISYHEHNAAKRREELLVMLREGKRIALISDAGTPAISDPGEDLVKAVAAEGLPIHPVPGGNAVLSALIASGLSCGQFTFEGFLPRPNKERKERLELLKKLPTTLVIYISPHRLSADLDDLLAALGNRPSALCRELTKVHESFYRKTLAELTVMAKEEEFKGEMVLVIEGANPQEDRATPTEEELRAELASLMSQGIKAKTAAQLVAEKYGLKKNAVYPLTIG
ncbi:MAG: 16S rRNA (cytidine(1402)-2'-O)-methyltransferase [Bacillota bacterium]|nr:16S rRNA (cytidine(1402)-2'-O)-methyltransferase [Bacillota bacterium]